MKKAVIFAAFWGNPKHVGVYRVGRIINWLKEADYDVTVVAAGLTDSINQDGHVKEIIVRDPLKLDLVHRSSENLKAPVRKPNALRRFLAFALFIPDAHIVWSLRAARSRAVRDACKDADVILSSSPLESQHIGSYLLAKYSGAKLLIDMRDGWIDEPLRPNIQKKGVRRTIESFIESLILKKASLIFVTTRMWAKKLGERLPFTVDKTVVITNGYPHYNKADIEKNKIESTFEILHAGQLKNSSPKRNPDLMFIPILSAIEKIPEKFTLSFYGKLDRNEIALLQDWNAKFREHGWGIKVNEYIDRVEILKRMMGCPGLLSFSVSECQLPSKLFEYLYLGRPVLVFSEKGSAVWEFGKEIPQFYLVDYNDPSTFGSIVEYFTKGCKGDEEICIPEKYHPEELKKIFLAALNKLLSPAS